MKKFLFFLFAFSLLLAQEPENVFVITIDGLRNDEGFEAESLYLRHIWNDLRPLGTINKKFWDRGWTATTGGHTTILSGVYQILLNNGSNAQDVRSFDPLMFEYYRKYFNAPESSCGVIVGKWGNVGAIANFGLEPSYSEPYKGFQVQGVDGSDSICSGLVHQAMDSLHPRLMLVNLGDVDHFGHAANPDTVPNYYTAITTADSIVYEFWKHIQAIPPYTDTFYQNKTVLIVMSDHGRHDDAHGGWKGHGNWDHGCRHIIFLALGPGIGQNRVIENIPRDQIDVVPTIAQILGFPAPFSEGEVMSEILADNFHPQPIISPSEPALKLFTNLSNNPGFSRDPDIACDRNGNVYCVWSDNSLGKWTVLFRKSTDGGINWLQAQPLFDYPEPESVIWYARVSADDSLAVCAMGYGKHANYIDSLPTGRMDTTFLWYPWIANSGDQGSSWNTISLLDSNMGSYYAPISVKNGRFSVAWYACGHFATQVPRNGIHFNFRNSNDTWRTIPIRVKAGNNVHIALQDDGTNYHIAATAFRNENWNIVYCRSTNGDSWNTTWVVDDPETDPQYDYDTELLVDDSGIVHLVWARKPNAGGVWQIMYGHRNPVTAVWDTFRLTNSSAGAWQPHIANKADTLVVAWTDYQDGNSEIYMCQSTDRGITWLPEERITSDDAFSCHPRVTILNDKILLVWQDYQDGNWEILLERINTGVGVKEVSSDILTRLLIPTVNSGNVPINFSLAASAKVGIKIYDITGKLIKKIVDKNFTSGYHCLSWDIKNERKHNVSAGVYYFILSIDGKPTRRKLIIY
ncbi:MAG: hypothetical protein OEW70_05225 [candidate division WOR-3 bacterium]|nr:hypothetical protein [candidate division WOR-3 bacterium]